MLPLHNLAGADFQVVTTEEASNTVDVGKVIRTDPAANTQAPRNSTITIFVSTGPSSVVMPNVVGMTESAAIQALNNSVGGPVKIELADAAPVNPEDKGKIASQSIARDTKVDKGTPVKLTVYPG